jgi:hypothetical protein
LAHAGARPASGRVQAIFKEEARLELCNLETWRGFAGRVAHLKEELLQFLDQLIQRGENLAAYGASAKGNTLLSYCGIGPDRLTYIVDASPLKQGYLTPGQHIPIYGPETLLERQPDVTLILAWNFAEEIFRQQAEYRIKGGRLAVPIPVPRLMDETTMSAIPA